MSFRFLSLFLCLALAWPLYAGAITVEITATVPGCGDGIIGPGEECDGGNLGGMSCSGLGYSGGVLSCTSACTLNTSQCSASSPGGGGSRRRQSGPVRIPDTNVVFTGTAYPRNTVTLLKDGQVVATSSADASGNFQMTISGLSGGVYNFSVYSEDPRGIRSALLTFPIKVTAGVTTKVGDIFVAPPILPTPSRKGDLNKDGRVNLVDFSIAAYWYKRALNPAFRPIETEYLNNDGRLDLVDFSIMAFYWTG